MAANGKTRKLTKTEQTQLRSKIASFDTIREFCEANKISAPTLSYPLQFGKCSIKTYNKIVKLKSAKQCI